MIFGANGFSKPPFRCLLRAVVHMRDRLPTAQLQGGLGGNVKLFALIATRMRQCRSDCSPFTTPSELQNA